MSVGLILDSIAWNALAISIIDAAFALQAFLAAIGPLGWAVGVVGALAGALVAMTGASEKAAKAELDNANALVKSNEAATTLNDRYQTLTQRIQDNTLSLGGRLQAEKEMREILEKLKRTGDDYLTGIDLEKMSLQQLAVVLQMVTDKRTGDTEAKRQQTITEKVAAEAALAESKAALAKMEATGFNTGDRGAATARAWAMSGLESKIAGQAKEYERLRTLVAAYGGQGQHNLG